MDYLRTLGSALVQKSGLNLPFSLGRKVTVIDGIVGLYEATRRDDGSPVSVFEYDFGEQSKKFIRPFATNAMRKLRTTRHPDVLKFMDAVETDSNIHIMTERVRPLSEVLQAWSSRDAKAREEWLIWGMHRISVALTFINDSCSSTHGKLGINSIFISPSGEWKLGGFELFSNAKEDTPILYTLAGSYPDSSSWTPAEVKKGGWTALKDYATEALDGYALGLLLHAVFNPTQPLPAAMVPPPPPPTAPSRGAIPTSIFLSLSKLLNPDPKSRLSPKNFLAIGMTEMGFFSQNRLVKVCVRLDNFSLASETEKNDLLKTLKDSADSFPPEFTSNHVLRALISALEFGGAPAADILPLVLQFGSNLPPDDYPNLVLTPIVKLYASPDRATRMALLGHLGEYADRLDKKTVSEKIFPHLQTGFSDTVAVIREATIKSIILLVPKFTDRILNNDLLRHLAHMQSDLEPSIRTNTCILLGRLGPNLGYNTKKKVLVPAFARAMKDTFVHTRVAGLMAFTATADCFDAEDIATKVIPNISFGMIDKEKLVRDQAFKTVDLYVKKLEKHAATMSETVQTEAPDARVITSIPIDQASLAHAAGAAGALAGWAISSLGNSLGRTVMSSDVTSTRAPMTLDATSDDVDQKSMLSPLPFSSKGMQLGGSKTNQNVITGLSQDWAGGSNDLIDINADQDDWSAFESSPPAIRPVTPISAAFSPGLPFSQGLQTNDHSSSSNRSTFLPFSPPTDKGQANLVGNVNAAAQALPQLTLSKEEKAAEMARRKEERKQRIALLKEQKKSATRT